MPAVGEAFCKIKDKCGERAVEVLEEINRLMDKVITIRYIRDGQATFDIAKKISEYREDDRDRISPMDALIVAAATTDPDCNVFFTTDSTLLSDTKITEIISGYRDAEKYKPLCIRDIAELIKA